MLFTELYESQQGNLLLRFPAADYLQETAGSEALGSRYVMKDRVWVQAYLDFSQAFWKWRVCQHAPLRLQVALQLGPDTLCRV
jgi:hypothetical protein